MVGEQPGVDWNKVIEDRLAYCQTSSQRHPQLPGLPMSSMSGEQADRLRTLSNFISRPSSRT